MVYKVTSIKSGRRTTRCAGWTLFEMWISIVISVIVLGALVSFALFNSRSLASVYNYIDMDQDSQKGIDQMSKDFRGAYAVSNCTGGLVIIVDATNDPLTYTYNTNKETVTRIYKGVTNVVLKECTKCEFGMEQRNVVPGTFDYFPALTVAECKAITVEFSCTRTLLGRRTWMETPHEVRFVIRN